VFVLKPLPPNNLSCKQLKLRSSDLFKIYRLDYALHAALEGFPSQW
jgi:hypothetical protein